MFKKLEHIATVGRDTDEASKFYRYQIGVPLIPSEVIEAANVRLTHLDLGNLHLQLVQSPTEDHQLREHLTEHGEGMHPLCFAVDDVPGSMAAFIDPATTRGMLWEMTGPPKG